MRPERERERETPQTTWTKKSCAEASVKINAIYWVSELVSMNFEDVNEMNFRGPIRKSSEKSSKFPILSHIFHHNYLPFLEPQHCKIFWPIKAIKFNDIIPWPRFNVKQCRHFFVPFSLWVHPPGDPSHWMVVVFVSYLMSTKLQAKFSDGGSVLGSNQFSILAQLPLKIRFGLKVVKIDTKTSNSLF